MGVKMLDRCFDIGEAYRIHLECGRKKGHKGNHKSIYYGIEWGDDGREINKKVKPKEADKMKT